MNFFTPKGQAKSIKKMNYTTEVKEIPKMLVFSKKAVLKDYHESGSFINGAMEDYYKIVPKSDFRTNSFSCYYENAIIGKDVKTEYFQEVGKLGENGDGFEFKEVPAIKAISVKHYGSYEEFGKCYEFSIAYIKEHGYKLCDAPREIYIVGPWCEKDVSKWVTEILFPIEFI